ncbi:MAG: hypothetical protein V3S35_05525, partial [Nitrosomonadaceae bacterium]
PVPEAAPVQEPAPVEMSDAISTYGPVKSGDTLAKIALEVAPHYQVQPNQMLVALLENVQDKIIRPMQENAIAREKALNEAYERISLLENVQDKIIRPMQENAIAREKVLNEGNERVVLLEKNIKELQHLLELKNPTMAKAQEQAESITPDAELSFSAVVPSMVEESSVASVEGEESSLFTWQWLWWVLLLPIAGWGWKYWKAGKNGATEAKQRHPSYYKFLDAYKALRAKERAVRSNTMS